MERTIATVADAARATNTGSSGSFDIKLDWTDATDHFLHHPKQRRIEAQVMAKSDEQWTIGPVSTGTGFVRIENGGALTTSMLPLCHEHEDCVASLVASLSHACATQRHSGDNK